MQRIFRIEGTGNFRFMKIVYWLGHYFNRRNFRERNFREFREFWPFSRKFVSRNFSKWQFAKVYPVKFVEKNVFYFSFICKT